MGLTLLVGREVAALVPFPDQCAVFEGLLIVVTVTLVTIGLSLLVGIDMPGVEALVGTNMLDDESVIPVDKDAFFWPLVHGAETVAVVIDTDTGDSGFSVRVEHEVDKRGLVLDCCAVCEVMDSTVSLPASL